MHSHLVAVDPRLCRAYRNHRNLQDHAREGTHILAAYQRNDKTGPGRAAVLADDFIRLGKQWTRLLSNAEINPAPAQSADIPPIARPPAPPTATVTSSLAESQGPLRALPAPSAAAGARPLLRRKVSPLIAPRRRESDGRPRPSSDPDPARPRPVVIV
ncbi:hypothetical protein AK830_g3320 [Neonectria ditissima]|uniref:Uncharacterized protein n=1 Tax=Neonectria ditissima TaxID=78410 RepID=A0A0P7BS95_9HYPO|nr:hypothetical protein AK830_g3320 [Neonectria ditissima]